VTASVAEGKLDLTARIGSVTLPNPVMTASGTAGHGIELANHLDLGRLGAVVVKSLAHFPWDGNPGPRLAPSAAGMVNSVGLQGPGVPAWVTDVLPGLAATGARIVVSIWGRTVDEYRRAAEGLAATSSAVVAVEVNLSCPNTEGEQTMFAHDPQATADVVEATAACGRPRWAKLSPNTDRLVDVAGAAAEAGAEAVTLINTVLGMVVDRHRRAPALGGGGGGLSGPAIHPVAVRAVHDVRRSHPHLPIVGVGGVADGESAADLLMAGAQAVQVGTATFADPASPERVLDQLERWAGGQGLATIGELSGSMHG
jgi:dihydroorotate dehydrogenase (NAD+) catalytic subunit